MNPLFIIGAACIILGILQAKESSEDKPTPVPKSVKPKPAAPKPTGETKTAEKPKPEAVDDQPSDG